MKQICYVHVRGQAPGKRIGKVQYLDKGYYATSLDLPTMSVEDVELAINEANDVERVPRDVRDAMEIGSMVGWRVPGARAALLFFGAPQVELEPGEEQKNAVTQGDILADGSVVAVIVSPEDVQDTAGDFNRELSLEKARLYLAKHAREVSDAMCDGWSEVLENLRSLEDFASEQGDLMEEEEANGN